MSLVARLVDGIMSLVVSQDSIPIVHIPLPYKIVQGFLIPSQSKEMGRMTTVVIGHLGKRETPEADGPFDDTTVALPAAPMEDSGSGQPRAGPSRPGADENEKVNK